MLDFLNLTQSDKWIVGFKTEDLVDVLNIDKSEIGLKLNTFTFNGVEMSETSIAREGETITLPALADNPDKSFTIGYFMDENWETFKFLLKWYSANSKYSLIDGDTTNYGDNIYLTNVSLYLLDNYKKPVLEIVFENCWIKTLGTFEFSYENPDIDIKTSLVIKYQQYKFKFLK